MTAVSCVIPTHQRAVFLAEALASVAAQDLAPTEIIVVSDVEDDATNTVVTHFRNECALPISLLTYTDGAGGASESRNRGLRAATSPYVAFLDDDDTWHPRFLSAGAHALSSGEAQLAIAWITMFTSSTTKDGPAIPSGLRAKDAAAINRGITGSNAVADRRFLLELGGFDPQLRMKNDTDLFFRFLLAGGRYIVVPERLVNQRKHDSGQLTGHSEARAANTERYMHKHAAHLSRADRRHLRFVIHRIRRHTAPTAAARLLHLALAVANYSTLQRQHDRMNRKDTEFYAVRAFDGEA